MSPWQSGEVMSRCVLTALAAVLAALLVSIQWQGRAETVAQSRDAELKAQFRRPSGGIPYPEDNPFSPAKYELGQMLFFEPLLSRSGSRACATCHSPGLSWGDGLPRAVGDLGVALPFRSPTLLNIAWIPVLGWDGRFPGLEDVTFAAITSPANMSLDV
jgi:cytochrome c peroxidase